MYGAVEFYKHGDRRPASSPSSAARSTSRPDARAKRDGKPELYHLLLLAKNHEGYRNLMAHGLRRLRSTGFYYKPQVDMELLERYTEGSSARRRA